MASPGNQHCANCIGTLSLPTKHAAAAVSAYRLAANETRRAGVIGLNSYGKQSRPGTRSLSARHGTPPAMCLLRQRAATQKQTGELDWASLLAPLA